MMKHLKIAFLTCFPIWLVFLMECDAIIEQIEATPRPSSGFFLGDLSLPQFILMFILTLQATLLYAVGVLPIEVDLSGMGLGSGFLGKKKRSIIDDSNNYTDINGSTVLKKKVPLSVVFIDCPLQYLCDLDFWAHKPHDSYIDSMIASWFINENTTWTDPRLATFGGGGTCPEMYPCPYDVQEYVGIRIPGSRSEIQTDHEQSDDVDLHLNFI